MSRSSVGLEPWYKNQLKILAANRGVSIKYLITEAAIEKWNLKRIPMAENIVNRVLKSDQNR